MQVNLDYIFDLEDREQFQEAFDAYRKIYDPANPDYQLWKHYYFLLWTLIEEATTEFLAQHDLRQLLQSALQAGEQHFSGNADFNFIAGYTISIFPYEYGDLTDMENISGQMLLKATELQPENPIYRMCYLASGTPSDAYKESILQAAPRVLETFSGKGCLNSYFREVLYRLDKIKN